MIYPGLSGQGASGYPSGFVPVEVHGEVSVRMRVNYQSWFYFCVVKFGVIFRCH